MQILGFGKIGKSVVMMYAISPPRFGLERLLAKNGGCVGFSTSSSKQIAENTVFDKN